MEISEPTQENPKQIIKRQNRRYPPHVLMLEILTRVSLGTLERCRLMSREWNHITYQSSFLKLYCSTARAVSGFLIRHLFIKTSYVFAFLGQPLDGGSMLSLDFVPLSLIVLAVSNQGLVYGESSEKSQDGDPSHFVCKPTTKEWLKIPNPKTRFTTYRAAMLVLHSFPLHYKIIRLSVPEGDPSRHNTIICEIFDSEKMAWKRLKNIRSSGFMYLNEEPPVFASGAFHWFTYTNKIFAFDINKESCELFKLPPQATGFYRKRRPIIQFQDKLAVLRYAGGIIGGGEERVQMWVMENYSTRSWKLVMERNDIANANNVVHVYTDNVAVHGSLEDLIWYDFNNGVSTTIKSKNDFLLSSNIYPFESDYESIFPLSYDCTTRNSVLKRQITGTGSSLLICLLFLFNG